MSSRRKKKGEEVDGKMEAFTRFVLWTIRKVTMESRTQIHRANDSAIDTHTKDYTHICPHFDNHLYRIVTYMEL